MSLTLPALAALLDAHAWLSDSLALARPARDRPLMPPSAPPPCRVLPPFRPEWGARHLRRRSHAGRAHLARRYTAHVTGFAW